MSPGFLPWAVMMLVWLGSIVFGCIAAATMVTYMRRTWQVIREGERGSTHDQLMDGIDRIETRLEAMSDRLERLEERERSLLGDGQDG